MLGEIGRAFGHVGGGLKHNRSLRPVGGGAVHFDARLIVQQEQRERMRQAVLERRQGPLREALKTCTDASAFLCSAVTGEEVRSILKENAANALIDKVEAIKHRITGDEYAELANALEAYFSVSG